MSLSVARGHRPEDLPRKPDTCRDDDRSEAVAHVPRFAFSPSLDPGIGMEVVNIARLQERSSRGLVPHRSDFHQLVFVEYGSTAHMVDFTWQQVTPAVALWVRPGQVQQFRPVPDDTRAVMLLFTDSFPAPFTGMAQMLSGIDAPARYDVRSCAPELRHVLTGIWAECRRPERDEEMLRHLVSVALMTLDRRSDHGRTLWTDGVFDSFVREVETSFSVQRSIDDYARRLGYSAKTLARSSRARTGLSPKAVIDRRRLLEAKRLLAHTDATIAAIASRVGHPDQSNFAKFFLRQEGVTPSQFRKGVRR